MMNESDDPGQRHINSIYRLTDTLIAECCDRFSLEVESRIAEVLKSFDVYRSARGQDIADGRERLYDAALTHNYVTAQCSTLLAFVNRMGLMVERGQSAELGALVNELRKALGAQYETFFREPPPGGNP